jgi:hypothetical protein
MTKFGADDVNQPRGKGLCAKTVNSGSSAPMSQSKRRRQRTAALKREHGSWCPKRRYYDEETARRCLWAMGNRGVDTSKMGVGRCRLCRTWHVVRFK